MLKMLLFKTKLEIRELGEYNFHFREGFEIKMENFSKIFLQLNKSQQISMLFN